jgi:hypothetical protein
MKNSTCPTVAALLHALDKGLKTLVSRPANLDAVLAAADTNLALTADALVTREHVIGRLTRAGAPTLRHLVVDTRIGDREALGAALQATLSAASILQGERRLVVITLADDLAPCPTMIRCIKNLMDAHHGRFVLSCPSAALAHAFRTHCMHLHCRVVDEDVDDVRAPFRDALRALLDVEDELEFWSAARAFALHATTSCMPFHELGAMLVEVAPCPEVVHVCAECDRAWRRSGDACTAFQAALVLTKQAIKDVG